MLKLVYVEMLQLLPHIVLVLLMNICFKLTQLFASKSSVHNIQLKILLQMNVNAFLDM